MSGLNVGTCSAADAVAIINLARDVANIAIVQHGGQTDKRCFTVRKLLQDIVNGNSIFPAVEGGEEFEFRRMMNDRCFLTHEWLSHFGIYSTYELPPKSRELKDIVNQRCPYIHGKKIFDTHFLFYVPPKMTFSEVWNLQHSESSFPNRCTSIADLQSDGCWYLALAEIVPNSNGKSYAEQLELLKSGYHSMNETEIGLMLTAHKLKMGEEMLSGNGSYARGGNTAADGNLINMTCHKKLGFISDVGPRHDNVTGILAYRPIIKQAVLC